MTTASDPQIVPRQPEYLPALRAADEGVASALESVISDNTRRVFEGWCADVGLTSLPAEPLTVDRYLAALTADVLAVIWLTAVQPRRRGRGFETAEQAEERGRFDVALVAALTWGDVQRWDDGSGRITVIRSKTDVEAQGAVGAITPDVLRALDAIRPVSVASDEKSSGCRNRGSPGGSRRSPKSPAWLTLSTSITTTGCQIWRFGNASYAGLATSEPNLRRERFRSIGRSYPVNKRRCNTRGLAGNSLAGFRATPNSRITDVPGVIVYAIRFKNSFLHR